MQYQGIVFDLYHDNGKPLWGDPPPSVRALFTKSAVSIDYEESDGTPVHIEASSRDGITYSGSWGYPSPDPTHPVELQAFESKKNNEVVLIGTWENKKDHRQGIYIFRL